MEERTVVFKGKFRVESVNSVGWHNFLFLKYNIDDVRKYIEEFIITRMQTIPNQYLLYKNPYGREEIEKIIEQRVQEEIVKVFGIDISLNTIYRDRTDLENDVINQNIAVFKARIKLEESYNIDKATAYLEINKGKVDQIKKLTERLISVTGMEGTEGEMEDLNKQIESLKNSLSPQSIPSMKEIEGFMKPESIMNANLIEYNNIIESFKETTTRDHNGNKDGSE